jgi:hypothetical protein
MLELTVIKNQMHLTVIYRTFHSNTKEYTFYSAPHGPFSKIDHILGHNTNLNRYKETEITPCILPYHHGLNFISPATEKEQTQGN